MRSCPRARVANPTVGWRSAGSAIAARRRLLGMLAASPLVGSQVERAGRVAARRVLVDEAGVRHRMGLLVHGRTRVAPATRRNENPKHNNPTQTRSRRHGMENTGRVQPNTQHPRPDTLPCYNSPMPELLWAPWRLEYIEKDTPQGGCIFVDLPRQENDRENLILFRGENAFVMLNAFPYTNGHLMIAPYKHTAEIEELDDATLLEINQLLGKCIRWIRETYKPNGFNIGVNLGSAAGAGIPTHIHWHIVPRWQGDTNYMTTVGNVRVMPQSLQDSYDRLKEAVERDAGAA